MLWRKEFEEGNENIVVLGIVVAERFFVFPDIEIGELYFLRKGIDKRFGYFTVEEIGSFPCQPAALKIVELIYQSLVLCKKLLKSIGVKYKPLIDVGNHQIFYLQVFMGNALPQIIKHQLLKRFGV